MRNESNRHGFTTIAATGVASFFHDFFRVTAPLFPFPRSLFREGQSWLSASEKRSNGKLLNSFLNLDARGNGGGESVGESIKRDVSAFVFLFFYFLIGVSALLWLRLAIDRRQSASGYEERIGSVVARQPSES